MNGRKLTILRGAPAGPGLQAAQSKISKGPITTLPELKIREAHFNWKKFGAVWCLGFASFFLGLAWLGAAPQGAEELASYLISPLGAESTKAEMDDRGRVAPQPADIISLEPEIIIPVIGVRSKIISPENTALNILNTALAKGVVHYPGSAGPGEVGNVFLFGHSTGLPAVHNKAYEVFNRLKELKAGDAIRIRKGNREYLYTVSSLVVKKADDARIELESREKKLTLSTCKIFGGKEDRYIVEADFVRSYPVRSL